MKKILFVLLLVLVGCAQGGWQSEMEFDDTKHIANDATWMCDANGCFLLKLDCKTGELIKYEIPEEVIRHEMELYNTMGIIL